MKYNHAFTIAFQLDSDNPGDKVTGTELCTAILRRMAILIEEDPRLEMFEEACGLPFDTYENE